jgi:hypothetical protein
MKNRYHYDEQDLLHGLQEEFYSDRSLRMEYVHGERHGLYEDVWKNGDISKGRFRYDKPHGPFLLGDSFHHPLLF